MTKQGFFEAYRRHLLATYDWAKANPVKLDRFMDSCINTVYGPENTWNHDGECVRAAWREIGGKGTPSLKTLRGLPNGTPEQA